MYQEHLREYDQHMQAYTNEIEQIESEEAYYLFMATDPRDTEADRRYRWYLNKRKVVESHRAQRRRQDIHDYHYGLDLYHKAVARDEESRADQLQRHREDRQEQLDHALHGDGQEDEWNTLQDDAASLQRQVREVREQRRQQDRMQVELEAAVHQDENARPQEESVVSDNDDDNLWLGLDHDSADRL